MIKFVAFQLLDAPPDGEMEQNMDEEVRILIHISPDGNISLRGIYYLTGIKEDLYDSYTSKIYAYTNGMNIPVTFK